MILNGDEGPTNVWWPSDELRENHNVNGALFQAFNKYGYQFSTCPGYINHLRNVAIVGASGTIGSHIVSALLKKGIFNVTAITRAE
jgi:hypothetical protein